MNGAKLVKLLLIALGFSLVFKIILHNFFDSSQTIIILLLLRSQ